MQADGGAQTRLTDATGADDSPAWSPDGATIAFRSARDGNRELYLVRPDGKGLRRLTNDPADDDLPEWSPDGSRIAFQSVRKDSGKDNYDIDVLGVADGKRTRLTTTPAYDGMYTWSPDGKTLAFISARAGDDALFVMPANGGETRRISADWSLNPAWSR
jgi:Tol biopolymer transport system component